MNKKSKKRLYNKKNKTLKRRKTPVARGLGSVTINLQRITDFAYVIPKDPNNSLAVPQIYLVAYDGDEHIGIVDSITSLTDKKFKFIPYLSREYQDDYEYNRWRKGQTFQMFEFNEIDIYSFN